MIVLVPSTPTPVNAFVIASGPTSVTYGMWWVTRPFVMESAEMADRLLPVTTFVESFVIKCYGRPVGGGNVVVPRYDAKKLVLGTVLSLPHTVCIRSQGSPYSV